MYAGDRPSLIQVALFCIWVAILAIRPTLQDAPGLAATRRARCMAGHS
jgi:hypothetical protein